MKRYVAALLLVLLAGCMTSGRALKRVSSEDVACSPSEITHLPVTYEVAAVRGVVEIATDADHRDFAPIPGASVVLRGLGGREQLGERTTDEQGRFAFGALAPGWYQLETCADGYNSVVIPVRVTGRHARDAQVHLRVTLAY